MKKILLFLYFTLFLNAQIVDKIIAVVNNIPITSYELQKTETKFNVNKKQALNILINQKLIESEIEKRGIDVDEFDIENAFEKIAMQNNMSSFEFSSLLAQQGKLKSFKEKLKKELQKEKLFSQIMKSKLSISEKELKTYYNTHKKDFQTFKTISYTKYYSLNPNILREYLQNPLINSKTITIKEYNNQNFSSIPLNLLFIFNKTKVNHFTPILPDNIGYSTYYIKEKHQKTYIPFEKVKNIIYSILVKNKENSILKEYFDKLKNRANIKFLDKITEKKD